MGIVARTPNRIDLAGGTLDIYPLYIFEEGGLTVNAAIQLYSTAEIESGLEPQHYSFYSKDLDKEISFKSLDACSADGELGLLIRAVKHYAPASGIRLTTHNEAPQGSGLGASSALLMAISAALNAHNEASLSIQQIVDIGANLEAQLIRIPTGKQDYLAAMHGGLNAIWFNESGFHVDPIPYTEKEIESLESRIVLSYTGIQHFSGENNWTIIRRYIDGEPDTVTALKRIKATSHKMRDALLKRDWEKVGEALAEEWENRKRLASGVTTDKVEHLMGKAREAGALAGKLCGAGGGGCMITWVEPHRKKAVEESLSLAGAVILPFKIALTGVEITQKQPKQRVA